MFTGIVTDVGRITRVEQGRDARAFTVQSAYDATSIAIGASIAHAGVCLTVIEKGADEAGAGAWHKVEVSNETLSKTTLGDWREGDLINLEQSLRMGDELGGHLVMGHVDGVGRLTGREQEQGSLRLIVEAPPELAAGFAGKGSVAIDGVSLTVNEVRDAPSGMAEFGVNIIPHTAEATTLGALRLEDTVNLEIDVVARYVARALQLGSVAS